MIISWFLGTTYKNTQIKEVGLYKQSLNAEDVFVLDKGLTIIQINTPNCDKDEKVTPKYGHYVKYLYHDPYMLLYNTLDITHPSYFY